VWILILPDRQVDPSPGFTIWDSTREYGFFDKSLNRVVCENPFRFYDHLIKAQAALFVMRLHELKDPDTGAWVKRSLLDFQHRCELVFVTCTGGELILARGRDRFDPRLETKVPLAW
jgi:hypothetical protein